MQTILKRKTLEVDEFGHQSTTLYIKNGHFGGHIGLNQEQLFALYI